VFELQRLGPDHEDAVLDFERENRAYFARSISDRGDEFFEHFAAQYRSLLDEQEAGVSVFHLLLDGDGMVVGRFNLYDVAGRAAVLGYRVAQGMSGRGVATSAVRDLCRIARDDYGLRTLRRQSTRQTWRRSGCWKRLGSWPLGRRWSEAGQERSTSSP
jgi:ribosomal-protein-alanine N-acetyltransferase